MNVRSRSEAKQLNTGKEQGLFAATPPLEGGRMQWKTGHHFRRVSTKQQIRIGETCA